MKIIVKNNIVQATHGDDQAVESLYPGTKALIIPDVFRKTDGNRITVGDNLLECLDLTTARTMMRKHIESGMTHALESGFVCSNGIKIQCAEIDMIRWMQAKSLIDLAGLSDINIRDYDNVIRSVLASDFSVMMQDAGLYIQGLLANAWYLKDGINSSLATISDVLNAQWPSDG